MKINKTIISDKITVSIQMDGFMWFYLKAKARERAVSENRDISAQDLIRDAIRSQYKLSVELTSNKALDDANWADIDIE